MFKRRKEYTKAEYPDEPNILSPGYIGDINTKELEFIHNELKRREGLRKRWGFKEGLTRISEKAIRHVALWGEQHNKLNCICKKNNYIKKSR